MTANTNWRCPVRHQAGHITHNNWFAKHRTIQNISDRSVRRLPHLFQVKFLYSFFIRGNCRTLYSNAILLNCIGSIYGNLVIGFIAVFNAKVIIFYIQLQVRKYQFVFYKTPDDSCHLVAIQFYNRVRYFNFLSHGFNLFFKR